MQKRRAWVDVIEASYRIEQNESDWLLGVLAAARPELDHGLGTWALSYDLRGSDGVQPRTPVVLGLPQGTKVETIMAAQASVAPEAIARTFQMTTCGTASQLLGRAFERKTSIDRFQDFGVGDTLGINVRDPTPTGCVFVGILPSVGALPRADIAVWKKVAAHIAAGFRLQRARGSSPATPMERASAIFTPNGKLEHAEHDVQDARSQLRQAVLAIESARGSLRKSAPEDAVAQWKGLVAARFTLLEHVEVGGRRYLLARENAPVDEAPVALTRRERQVVSYAALGHENKLIAYELGIAASTVRVLLARAAAKLGTSERADTLRAFVAMTRAFEQA